MFNSILYVDKFIRKFLAAFCMLMLFLMVFFTDYTVIMRYIFEDPPVWGDLLTVLSNIWLVFIALVLTVREKEHIALNVIYSRLPTKFGFLIQQFWTLIIFSLGVVICITGLMKFPIWEEDIGKCGILLGKMDHLYLNLTTCLKNMQCIFYL